MIPCHFCGKDASTGWTKGFVPAPDSQKLALCAEHNTPENRLCVAKAWHALLTRDLAVMTDVLAFKAAVPSLQAATVHFTGGGMLSFTCLSCAPTEQGTLCLESPLGVRNYIPLQHIREYSVRPYFPEKDEQETTNAPRSAQAAPPSFPASLVHPVTPDDKRQAPLSSSSPSALPGPLSPVTPPSGWPLPPKGASDTGGTVGDAPGATPRAAKELSTSTKKGA